MAWVEIMLPNARTLPTGKLTQNPIRTGERRCILYVGDDSGITLAWDHATHPWTIRGRLTRWPCPSNLMTALFGVLTVNLVTIFRHSLFEEFLHGPEDAWARAVSFGLEFKAVTLFSLLFGIGLEAQRERIDGFDRYIVRRLVFLLVVGLAHLFLFWNGDILTLYALYGLVVAPLLRLPTRALLGLAILLFVLQIVPVPYPPPFGTANDLREHVEAAGRAYRDGTFVQALKFRIEEVRPMGVLLVSIAP